MPESLRQYVWFFLWHQEVLQDGQQHEDVWHYYVVERDQKWSVGCSGHLWNTRKFYGQFIR